MTCAAAREEVDIVHAKLSGRANAGSTLVMRGGTADTSLLTIGAPPCLPFSAPVALRSSFLASRAALSLKPLAITFFAPILRLSRHWLCSRSSQRFFIALLYLFLTCSSR